MEDLAEAEFMPEDLWLAYKHYIGGIGDGEHQKEERVRFFIFIFYFNIKNTGHNELHVQPHDSSVTGSWFMIDCRCDLARRC